MKTKRRHELQTNYLSDWINNQLEIVQPYSKVLLGAAIVLVGAFASWGIFVSQQGKKSSESWESFYEARNTGDSDELLEVVQKYPDTIAAIWAKQQAATLLLNRGQRLLYGQAASREQAAEDIETAVGLFKDVIIEAESRSEDTTFVRKRAHFGAGAGYESLADDLPKAVEQYKRIVDQWEGSALALAAQERIDAINSKVGHENQDWILSHTPTSPAAMAPRSQLEFGTGPGNPFGVPTEDSPEDLDLSSPTLEERLESGESGRGLDDLFGPDFEEESTVPGESSEAVPDVNTAPDVNTVPATDPSIEGASSEETP